MMLPKTALISVIIASVLAITTLAFSASTALAETYTSSAFPCNKAWGGGQIDAAGTTYLACGSKVVRRRLDGSSLADITLPASANEVAPSPDGAFIYWTGSSTNVIKRMIRQQNGSYAADTSNWALANFQAGAQTWIPKGRYVQTDNWGDIYVSVGAWVTGYPNMIVKYSPAGAVKAQFGDYGPAAGQFNVNQGIAVSRDGRTVYVADELNGRIQRFDYGIDGTYHFTLLWGQTDSVNCAVGKFAAPYDVNLDPWGYVYVMDTSCQRVQKFTANGASLGTIFNTATRTHATVTDGHGNVYVAGVDLKFTRTSPEPGAWPAVTPLPPPDSADPILDSVTVPTTTFTQIININIVSHDDTGVTEYRIANEDGNYGAWKAIAATVSHTLTTGYGPKTIIVQVRDGAGRESNAVIKTTSYQPDPLTQDVVAPTLESASLPGVSGTQSINVDTVASDNVEVAKIRFANEDGNWAAWTAYLTTAPWTLSNNMGAKGVFVQVADAAGNASNVLYKTLVYGVPGDVAAPMLNSALLPAATTTQAVDLVLDATDDVGVTQVRTANEDGNWSTWRAFATTVNWTLTAGYGPKAVFVQVRDAAGKESNTILARTTFQKNPPPPGGGVDTQAPVLNDATLPAATTSQTIAVQTVATDNAGVVEIRFANEDGTWGGWADYATSVSWTLTAGYGNKAVFVQVRDASGNESNTLLRRTSFQETVGPDGEVDAADPVLSNVVVPNPAVQRLINVTLQASDDIGVTQVRMANEDGTWSAWMPYAASVEWTLTAGAGNKAIFVQVRDAAGKESNTMLVRTVLQ